MPDGSTIPIAQNLCVALRHFRHQKECRRLWVDALCINQEDDNERSSQVPLMGGIYRRANRVIAWIGPEENNSSEALELISYIGRQVEINWRIASIRPAKGSKDLAWAELAAEAPFNERQLQCLSLLFQRPWFERIWVRQEISLATQAIMKCGNKEVEWTLFRKGAYTLFRQPGDIWAVGNVRIPHLRLSRLIQQLCRIRPGFIGYRDLRVEVYGTKCKNPRDMVYAVLSLVCAPDQLLNIQPNYGDSVAKVYGDVVRDTILRRRSLKILVTCELSSKVLDIPSWIPDWSSPFKQVNLPWVTWSACAWISPRCRFMNNGRTFRVAGVEASRVATARATSTADHDSETSRQDMVDLIRRFKPSGDFDRPYKGDETIIEAYSRVFAGLGFADDFDPPDTYWPAFDQTVQDVRNIWASDDNYDQLKKRSKQPSEAFFRACTMNVGGRCIFESADGLVGLAPLGTCKGDLICVLLGYRFPIVLRKHCASSKATSEYQIVGTCYVPGLMMGEAIHGSLHSFYRPVNKFGSKTPTIENYRVGMLDTRTNTLVTDPSTILGDMGIRCERYERQPHVLDVAPETLQEARVSLQDFDIV